MPLTLANQTAHSRQDKAKKFSQLFNIEKCDYRDFLKLARYHYCPGRVWPAKHIFKLSPNLQAKGELPDPVAVVLYRLTLPKIPARNTATANFFQEPATLSDQLKLVNKHILYLARLIVDPRFRRLRLATKLVRETLKLVESALVETLIPVGGYQNIFLRCGFKSYYNPTPPKYIKLRNTLLQIGITEANLYDPQTVQRRINNLDPTTKAFVTKRIESFLKTFKSAYTVYPGLERTKYMLERLIYPNCYLLWFNPKTPEFTKKIFSRIDQDGRSQLDGYCNTLEK